MKLTPVDCEGLHIKGRDLPKSVAEMRNVPKTLDYELICFDSPPPTNFYILSSALKRVITLIYLIFLISSSTLSAR